MGKLFDEFAKVEVGDSSPASGQFILKIFRYATDKLSMDARHLEELLATETWRILGVLDLTRSMSDLQHTEHLRSPRATTPLVTAQGLVKLLKRTVQNHAANASSRRRNNRYFAKSQK